MKATGKGSNPATHCRFDLAERKRRIAMQRITTKVLFVLAVITLVGGIVWAASPHYKKAPQCVDNGSTVTCSGSIAGLGNGDVRVDVTFDQQDGSTGTTICTSPGGNDSPGQNPAVPVNVSGSQLITRVKNGNVTFSVTTDPPPAPTAASAGCANPNWSARFDDITFHGGTLTIRQDDGTGTFLTVASLTIDPLFP